MDIADTRFGPRARDRDEIALQVLAVFKKFLEEYTGASPASPSSDQGSEVQTQKSKYAEEALVLLSADRNTLFVDFKDIELFDADLADNIICDYYRFYPYLCRALASFARDERIRQAEGQMDPNADVATRTYNREMLKKQLDRPLIKDKQYYVGFYNFAGRDNIRDLSSTKIGVLTRVSGQVVRAHTVHPELVLGCFKCKDCLQEQYTQQQFRYTQPNICVSDQCNNRTRFELIIDKSRFTDFQRLRIQETQQELPRGCIPRSFDVIIHGTDAVECIQPGDQCDFIGTLIAVPDVGQMMGGVFGTVSSEISGEGGVTGLKSLGVKEMTYSLAYLSHASILEGQTMPCLNTDEDHREAAYGTKLDVNDFKKEEIMRIQTMSGDKNLLVNLSESLFSSVHGSADIKKGILLQLLSGVPKQTDTGTKLRGDINVCLVGDPSTAKSQFLKIVADFAPIKAVYASGKASSASGLTAAVVRDTDGGFVIEAGALMLADRGICCIDEFDKMELKDQVAIHEAMEQQTISITKAGVSATLNARASILAAANPIGGLYDRSRDLRSNLGFSLPIMSRFDIFFTILDPNDEQNDFAIASRICHMHANYDKSASHIQKNLGMVYSFEDIRLYLRFARKYYPSIPFDTEKMFTQEYLRLRTGSIASKTSWRITVRQLESLIRLSEAIARAHCSEIVKPEYVKMAAELIEKTIVHVGNAEVDLPVAGALGGDQASQGMYEGEEESQPLEPTQATQQAVKIPLALYKQMAQVLMIKLRIESEDTNRTTPAMRRSELLDWYLHRCVDEISTEAELIRKKVLCEKVLDRLIKTDQVLMELKDSGDVINPDQSPDPDEDADRYLMVNPLIPDEEDFFDQVHH